MAEKCFFDEIIECLETEKDKRGTAFVQPEVLHEFFSDRQAAAEPLKTQSKPDEIRPVSAQHIPPPAAPAPVSRQSAPAAKIAVENLSLTELRAVALNCRQCKLHSKRNTVVFGEGNPLAELMFVGEGPGMEEDQQGRPFVGAAGQLLDKMIIAMGFKREDVYIANIVKCRPPNNRNPEEDEATQCLPYLKRQIELVSPKVIVALGAVPMLWLTGKTGIMKLRGQWTEYQGVKLMPTYHPAYLLRNAGAKKDVWSDLQQVMQVFGKTYQKPG
ncbi:MAG: uracil-DNA glycosylase [Victivallaceae bacterium]